MSGNTRKMLNMSTADFDSELDREANARLVHHRTHKSDAESMEVK